ncbi:MAG: SET domain-containing protein-lysine N-methyltransferase [Proteobacteria bacterium]|nr:SET domain-containing protein-lysine N-methyltransferase [Pseudomonadota bacterium]
MQSSPPLGYVRDTGTAKGRGVFATRAIAAGETVEIAPAIVLTAPWLPLPIRLRHYVFNWGNLTKGPKAIAMAMGYGSMYNHANPANLRYEGLTDGNFMRFIADRDIAAEEEMTINYNACGTTTSEADTWFKANGIQPF